MMVLMLLLLTQSLWSAKARKDEPGILFESDVYDPDTGEELDARILAEKLEDRDESSSLRPFPKEGFQGGLYIAYNDAALEKYGKENVGKKVVKVFSFVKRFFLDKSTLGTTINFTLVGYGHWPINTTSSEVKNMVTKISKIYGKKVNHIALLNGEYRIRGRTLANTFCQKLKPQVSVNGVDGSFHPLTARIVAHEIGHGLGMSHDIDRPCDQHRIMSAYIKARQWSNCSRNSFLKYFNNRGGKIGRFCLNPNVCVCNPKGSIGLGCSDGRNRCTCKRGYIGPKCDICWQGADNVGTEEEPECGCIMKNVAIDGAILEVITGVPSLEACHQICVNNPGCSHFTANKDTKYCWLKGFKAIKTTTAGAVAGTRICADNAKNIIDCIEQDTDYPGWDIANEETDTAELCQKSCQDQSDCDAWVWRPTDRICWIQSMIKRFQYSEGFVSGPRNCQQIKPYNGPLNACECNWVGTVSCDAMTGNCQCREVYREDKCTRCRKGFTMNGQKCERNKKQG